MEDSNRNIQSISLICWLLSSWLQNCPPNVIITPSLQLCFSSFFFVVDINDDYLDPHLDLVVIVVFFFFLHNVSIRGVRGGDQNLPLPIIFSTTSHRLPPDPFSFPPSCPPHFTIWKGTCSSLHIIVITQFSLDSVIYGTQTNLQYLFACRFKPTRNIPRVVKTYRCPKWSEIIPVKGIVDMPVAF